MRNIIKLTGVVDNLPIAIDSHYIFAISGMSEDNLKDKEGNVKRIPKHTLVFTEHTSFRVIDTVESILKQIKKANQDEIMGL